MSLSVTAGLAPQSRKLSGLTRRHLPAAVLVHPHFGDVEMAGAGLHGLNLCRVRDNDSLAILAQLSVGKLDGFVCGSAARRIVNEFLLGLCFSAGMRVAKIRRQQLFESALISLEYGVGPLRLRVENRLPDARAGFRRGKTVSQSQQAENELHGSLHGLHSFTMRR